MRDLFRQFSSSQPLVRGRRLSAIPVSVTVHAAVLLAVVVIPLLASDVLPAVRVGDVIFETVMLPRVPSVPPPAAPRQVSVVPPDADLAPVVQPSRITEPLIRQDVAPDIDAPDAGGVIMGEIPASFDFGVVSEAPPAPRAVVPVPAHTLLRPPVRLHDAPPVYPELARAAQVQGTVIIQAVINTSGDVTDAKVLRSIPLLDQSALDAVRQWKYSPTLLNGVPVPVVMTVTVTFTLR